MSDEAKYVELGGVVYRRILHHGYYMLRPVVDGRITQKEVPEHRVVYEVANGVELDEDIYIHHLNRDKADNRPENLIALRNSDHNRLHAFEDRNMDMKSLAELDSMMQSYNSKKGIGARKAVSESLSKLVAYESVIYHKIESDGYTYLSPLVNGKIDYKVRIPEHRLVYELANGVKLPDGAIVEHVNGDKSDNRPENLVYNGLISSHYNTPRLLTRETEEHCAAEQAERKRQAALPISKERLSELIETNSNAAIAKIYGVSDGTIASWRKKYDLPSASEQHGWKRGRAPKFDPAKLEVIEVTFNEKPEDI